MQPLIRTVQIPSFFISSQVLQVVTSSQFAWRLMYLLKISITWNVSASKSTSCKVIRWSFFASHSILFVNSIWKLGTPSDTHLFSCSIKDGSSAAGQVEASPSQITPLIAFQLGMLAVVIALHFLSVLSTYTWAMLLLVPTLQFISTEIKLWLWYESIRKTLAPIPPTVAVHS